MLDDRDLTAAEVPPLPQPGSEFTSVAEPEERSDVAPPATQERLTAEERTSQPNELSELLSELRQLRTEVGDVVRQLRATGSDVRSLRQQTERFESKQRDLSKRVIDTRDDLIEHVDASIIEMSTALEKRESIIGQRSAESASAILSRLSALASAVDGQVKQITDVVIDHAPDITAQVTRLSDRIEQQMGVLAAHLQQVTALSRTTNERFDSLSGELVRYLAQRDERLEAARDRIMVEVIDEISTAMRPRDRVRLMEALRLAEQRRQDRRDAERYRKRKSKSGTTEPTAEQIKRVEADLVPPPPERTSSVRAIPQVNESEPIDQTVTPSAPAKPKSKPRAPAKSSQARSVASKAKPTPSKPKAAPAKAKPTAAKPKTPSAKPKTKSPKVVKQQQVPPLEEGSAQEQQ